MYIFMYECVHVCVYVFVSQPAVVVRLPAHATTSSAVIDVTRASSSQTAQKVCFVIMTIMHITCIRLKFEYVSC